MRWGRPVLRVRHRRYQVLLVLRVLAVLPVQHPPHLALQDPVLLVIMAIDGVLVGRRVPHLLYLALQDPQAQRRYLRASTSART